MLKPLEDLVSRLLLGLPGRSVEILPLEKSIRRVAAVGLVAAIDQPSYNESLRDGFALHRDYALAPDGRAVFEIRGEIAAGDMQEGELVSQQAFRVMTGAQVPGNCSSVIPKEVTCTVDGQLVIPGAALQDSRSFIKKKGEDITTGESIAQAGTVLCPALLASLAAVAVDQVRVFEQPLCGFFTTGKELVSKAVDLGKGKKVSSNQYLLPGLLTMYGAHCCGLGIAGDDCLQLESMLLSAVSKNFDVLVSTGGTGPGKFDLIERTFLKLGGEVYSTRLGMLPGKSVVVGRMNNTIFCGLPGPPSAVEVILHEFVGPLLLKLQGVGGQWPRPVQAYLEQDFELRVRDVVQVKSGVYQIRKGMCWVRRAAAGEPSTCNVIVPQKMQRIKAGTLVDVHMKVSPFSL